MSSPATCGERLFSSRLEDASEEALEGSETILPGQPQRSEQIERPPEKARERQRFCVTCRQCQAELRLLDCHTKPVSRVLSQLHEITFSLAEIEWMFAEQPTLHLLAQCFQDVVRLHRLENVCWRFRPQELP